tara:strand:+ start:246 stop:788 length:543 start_codon:yes stop_codon:yes gene_type:complete
MNKEKVIIASKTLKQLENKSWSKILLSEIVDSKKNINFKNKNELLININKYIDFTLKKNLINLEVSSSKDMLFEVLMARLDILNSHRKSIKNLVKYFKTHPHHFIKLIPSFGESTILMATLSNININGVTGIAKIKVIFILYILTINTWTKDETKSLEKTMTTLDNYLNNLEKLIRFFND